MSDNNGRDALREALDVLYEELSALRGDAPRDALSVLPEYRNKVAFTTAEVGHLLGLNPEVVRQHVAWGGFASLPRTEPGQRIRIPREEVIRILDEGFRTYEE